MSTITLLLLISLPIIVITLGITYFLLLKFKPVVRRPFLFGTAYVLIVMASGIGLSLVNIFVAVAWFCVFMSIIAMWIWFALQPATKKSKEKAKQSYEKYHNKKRNY